MANLPRPGGDHPYSHGATISGLRQWYNPGEGTYNIEISSGIDYGRYELGFNDNGQRMNPRGMLEQYNFRIMDQALERTSRLVAGWNGSVSIK